MATEIKMPQLSDTMNSGKILSWKKKEGDAVKRGDVLAEVETEKANLEIEAYQNGTLLKITTPAGTAAKVGEAIAYIGQPGEEIPSGGAKVAAPAPAPQPAPKAEPAPAPRETSAPIPQAPQQSSSNYAAPAMSSSSSSASGRVKASPLARKIAADRNLDLTVLSGSGPDGRIVRKDVERFQGAPRAESQTQGNAALAPERAPRPEFTSAEPTYTPLSKMRETIARRMVQAVNENPHFYVTTAIDMGPVQKLREVLKQKPSLKDVNVTHFIIKAAAFALQEVPRVNCAYRDGKLYNPGSINIGIITALEDGLLIPVIKDANQLAMKDLAFEASAAIQRAKAGRPTAQDLSGGTFSISNMGNFDIDNFTAIINPGQGAVLAVSSVRQEAVVVDGEVTIGQRMRVTLSVDHRIIDGVAGAQWLKAFKQGLENPALLLM